MTTLTIAPPVPPPGLTILATIEPQLVELPDGNCREGSSAWAITSLGEVRAIQIGQVCDDEDAMGYWIACGFESYSSQDVFLSERRACEELKRRTLAEIKAFRVAERRAVVIVLEMGERLQDPEVV